MTGEKFASVYDEISDSIRRTENRIKSYRYELSKLSTVSKEQAKELERIKKVDEVSEDARKYFSELKDLREADIRSMIAHGEVPIFPDYTDPMPLTNAEKFFKELRNMREEDARLVGLFGEAPVYPLLPEQPKIDAIVIPVDPEIALLDQRVADIKTWEEAQVEAYDKAEAAAQRFSNTVSSTFASAAVGGKTMREAISQVTSSLIQMAAQAWINYLIMKALGFAVDTPNLFNFNAPTANGALDPFGGAGPDILENAKGGHIRAGQLSLVGEEGVELFRPSTSGTIIPNGEGAGMGGITFNIDARGAGPGVELAIRAELEDLEERAITKSVQSVMQLRSNGVI